MEKGFKSGSVLGLVLPRWLEPIKVDKLCSTAQGQFVFTNNHVGRYCLMIVANFRNDFKDSACMHISSLLDLAPDKASSNFEQCAF